MVSFELTGVVRSMLKLWRNPVAPASGFDAGGLKFPLYKGGGLINARRKCAAALHIISAEGFNDAFYIILFNQFVYILPKTVRTDVASKAAATKVFSHVYFTFDDNQLYRGNPVVLLLIACLLFQRSPLRS
jgi:hypothetical protein